MCSWEADVKDNLIAIKRDTKCLQRQLKYVESRLRAVKARNEYLLCLEAANASLQKYYSDDLHELISVSCRFVCELLCLAERR